jgi:hypothetical protein
MSIILFTTNDPHYQAESIYCCYSDHCSFDAIQPRRIRQVNSLRFICKQSSFIQGFYANGVRADIIGRRFLCSGYWSTEGDILPWVCPLARGSEGILHQKTRNILDEMASPNSTSLIVWDSIVLWACELIHANQKVMLLDLATQTWRCLVRGFISPNLIFMIGSSLSWDDPE